ncbi:PREDICTED: guanylate-binding protein 4-like [Nanorana parkeri]|uniref:guanylate-binding protein 4-like n=1 Tax=Nanorana parkeri TaxID=125878 RepID=UPI000854617E|nr:PREDICTED: guanylate-binding protein 4-like [Nanorana parkeri]
MAIRMKAPVCLIENHEDGTLQVNSEAADILSSIDQPVVVVGIVGMYRTGKSYLMNKLAKANRGFELGATVQSKTKGIWMWCVPHPTKEDHTLVLLDTEGLGDVEKGDKSNDMNIFCLSVILSSALVYNSKGTIDEDAIEKLRFVSELADFIKVKSKDNEDEEDEFSRHFPIFIWAVRDFVLKLECDGKKITEDEYLENALAPQTSERINERNQCRGCIRMYFKTRKCFVFEPPSGKSDVLQRMDEVSEEELNPTFLDQTEKFCTYIYKNADVKYLDQILTVKGKMLRKLVTLYTEAIMSKVTCMENVVMSISKMENEVAVQEATEHYEKMMKERGRFPTETDQEFSELSAQCEKEALQIFMKKSFKDSELSFQKQYMEKMEQKKSEFSEMNKMKSLKHCEELIGKHSKGLDEAVRQGLYCTPGGHQKFQEDMEQIVERYNKEPGKGLQVSAAVIISEEFRRGCVGVRLYRVPGEDVLALDAWSASAIESCEDGCEFGPAGDDAILAGVRAEAGVFAPRERLRNEISRLDENSSFLSYLTENKSRSKMEELERKLQEAKSAQESKKDEHEKRTFEMNLTARLEKQKSENLMLREKLNFIMQGKEREQELYTRQGCYDDARMYHQQVKDLKQETEELKGTSWVDSAVNTFCSVAQCFSWQGVLAAGVAKIVRGFFK